MKYKMLKASWMWALIFMYLISDSLTSGGELFAQDMSKGGEDMGLSTEYFQTPIDIPEDVMLNILFYLAGDVTYNPESQGMAIYHVKNLTEPKYIEVKLKPYGYIIASLTKEDLPVIRFNGDEDSKAPTDELGEAYKYVTYDESFDILAIDSTGKIIKSLSNPKGGGNISDFHVLSEKRDLLKQTRIAEAEKKWSHDYVFECNREQSIPLCSNSLTKDDRLRFPDDFETSTTPRTSSGAQWDEELKIFVELEKQGDNWVKGNKESAWERSHISTVVDKRAGKCGMAQINVPCDTKILNKPLWLGNTRITIVGYNLEVKILEENSKASSVHRRRRTFWSAWSTWTTYSADDYTTVPNYNTHSCCGCNSGSGAVAWAMLFAWADRRSDFSNTIYGTATELPPTTMTSAVQTYVESIRSAIGSFCLFFKGATNPSQMGNVKSFFQSRGGGDLQTSYSPLGIFADQYRNCARDEIVNNRRPVVLGTVWLKHYPVATQYRVRTRTQSGLFGVTFLTETDHEAYLNQGWGGSGNGWTDLQTWFCGTIDP